jgi:multiple sugar transport system substrate-binding protein
LAVTTPGGPESPKTKSRVTVFAAVVALGGIALGAGIWQMLHAKRSAAARQSATRINLSVDPIGLDAAAKQVQLFEQQHPDTRVNIVTVPSASDGRHDLFVKQLSSKSPALDVFWGDVTWAGEFISKGWVLPLTRALTNADQAAYWKGPMDGCRGPDGAIYCIPSYVDAGVLYYRKDLLDESGLKPPKTWDDLVRISTTVSAKHKDMSGIVFQADQYEGLTVNFLEYAWGNNGSIQSGAKLTAVSRENEEALQFMVDMIHKYKIAPAYVLGFQEDFSRRYFEEGKAVFLRNWPYVWRTLKGTPVEDKVGIVPVVHGRNGESAAALGGWNIMVGRYSQNPEASIALAGFLGGTEAQTIQAMDKGDSPAVMALYHDQKVVAANPFLPLISDVLGHTRPRPVVGAYRQGSAIFQKYIHQALAAEITPKAALAKIQQELDALQQP